MLALIGRWVAGFFSDDPTVVDVTAHYLFIVPLSYCAYGIVMVVNASFNGLGRPMPGVVVSAARVIVVLLPLAFVGNWLFDLTGVFIAIAISNLLVGAGAYFWIHRVIRAVT